MQGLFRWVSDTAQSIYDGAASVCKGAVSVISATTSTVSMVGKFLVSPTFHKGFGDWLLQSWDGFSRTINPLPLITLYAHPNVSRVWRSSQAALLLRLAPKLLVRPLVSNLVRIGVISNPVVETVAVSALDAAATIYLLKTTIGRYTDDALHNLNMAKASADDSAPEPKTAQPGAMVPVDTNPMVNACEHGAQAHAMAGAMSTIHYFGSLVALDMFAAYIPYGNAVTLPFKMLLIGRGFTEYPLAAAGNCSDCRKTELNKNNPYNMGVGGAFEASKFAAKYGIWLATGAEGFLVDEVVTSMLTLNFIMEANLNRKIKLPGTKPGIDYFKISRACSEVAVWQFYGWLEQQFQTPGKGDWYQETKKVIARKLNSEAMKFLCRVMVDQNLQDWDEFAKRPASKMFFELYGGMLISVIEYVQSERSKASYQTINGANQWVNTKEENEFVLKRLAKATVDAMISAVASQDDKKILSILMQPELEAPLREWHSYLTKHSDTTKSVIHDTLDLIEDYGSLPPVAPAKHKQPIYDLNAAATVNKLAPVWDLKKSPRTINNLFHSVDDKPAPERVTPNVIASPKAEPRVAELVEKVPDEKSVTTVVPSVDKPAAPRRPATPPSVCQVAGLYGAMDDVNASNAGATLGSQTFHLLRAVKK